MVRGQNPDCLATCAPSRLQTVMSSCGSGLEIAFSGGRNYLQGAVKQKCLKGLKDWKEKGFISFQCGPVRSASGGDSK